MSQQARVSLQFLRSWAAARSRRLRGAAVPL